MKILIKKTDGLIVPKTATELSAGYDITAMSDPIVHGIDGAPDEEDVKKKVWLAIDYIEYKTGVFIAPQQDYEQNNYHTYIFPRSSLSKYNLALANSVAVIDNDYRGEVGFRFKYVWQPQDLSQTFVKVPLSDGGTDYTFEPNGFAVKINYDKIYKKGDKIGQFVASITHPVVFELVDDLNQTVRGSGGFGHSDGKEIVNQAPDLESEILKKFKSMNNVTPVGYEKKIKERETNQ
jgi:dUTP pyrophosphatase